MNNSIDDVVRKLQQELETLKQSRIQDQTRLEQLEIRMNIMDNVFKDLTSVEKEHETQYTLHSLELNEEDSHSGSLAKHFCCFFCQ